MDDDGVLWAGWTDAQEAVGELLNAPALVPLRSGIRPSLREPSERSLPPKAEPVHQEVVETSVVDCQTVATVPRTEIVRRLGRFPPEMMHRIDQALEDSLGLAGDPAQTD